jgi:hypothetical protein
MTISEQVNTCRRTRTSIRCTICIEFYPISDRRVSENLDDSRSIERMDYDLKGV